MDVCAIQYDIAWEDKAANFARVRALLAGADPAPGGLIVLPEMFATGFSMNVAAICEGRERAAEGALAEFAAERGCAVLGGVVTRAADGRGRNQAVLVGPDGRELARYTKMHPFSFAGETAHYAPGERPVVVEWGGAKLAPFVCYDLRFPEVFRSVTASGAEVLAVIANWPASRREHWRTLLRARAIENQAYVVGVNRIGADPNVAYSGDSLIVGPRGEVLADAGTGQCTVCTRLDLGGLRAYRKEFPALKDMKEGWVRTEI